MVHLTLDQLEMLRGASQVAGTPHLLELVHRRKRRRGRYIGDRTLQGMSGSGHAERVTGLDSLTNRSHRTGLTFQRRSDDLLKDVAIAFQAGQGDIEAPRGLRRNFDPPRLCRMRGELTS